MFFDAVVEAIAIGLLEVDEIISDLPKEGAAIGCRLAFGVRPNGFGIMVARSKGKVAFDVHKGKFSRRALLVLEQEQPNGFDGFGQRFIAACKGERWRFVPRFPNLRVAPEDEHGASIAFDSPRVAQIGERGLTIGVFAKVAVELAETEDGDFEIEGALLEPCEHLVNLLLLRSLTAALNLLQVVNPNAAHTLALYRAVDFADDAINVKGGADANVVDGVLGGTAQPPKATHPALHAVEFLRRTAKFQPWHTDLPQQTAITLEEFATGHVEREDELFDAECGHAGADGYGKRGLPLRRARGNDVQSGFHTGVTTVQHLPRHRHPDKELAIALDDALLVEQMVVLHNRLNFAFRRRLVGHGVHLRGRSFGPLDE